MRIASHPSYDRSISASTYESLLYSREQQLRMNKRMFIEAKKQFIVERRKLMSERWASLPFYQEIVENFANELNANGLLTEGRKLTGAMLISEGFWDSLQATVGNGLGSMDNFFKKIGIRKEPEGYEETMQLFQQVVGKATDKKVAEFLEKMESEIQDLELEEKTKPGNTQFPYNKHAKFFANGVVQISCFYESIKKAVESGEMPEPVGNQFIRELRISVEKYIKEVEREKGGMYTQVGSGDYMSAESLKASAGEKVEEADGKLDEAELSPEDLKKFEDKVQDPEYKATLDKISSLKGPAILAALGITTAAAGWLMGSTWFQDIVKSYFQKTITTPDKVENTTQQFTQAIREKILKDGPEGAAQNFLDSGCPDTNGVLKKMAERKMASPEAVAEFFGPNGEGTRWLTSQPGYDGPKTAGEAIFKDWGSVSDALTKHATTGGSPERSWIGALAKEGLHKGATSATQGWGGFIGGAVANMATPTRIAGYVVKTMVKKTIVKGFTATVLSGKGIAVIGAMTALSPILVSVGITGVALAAVWALWKVRLKNKSRLGVLTMLKSQMVDVKGPPVEVKPEDSPGDVTVDIILKDPSKGDAAPVADKMPKGLPSPKEDKEEKGTKKESKYSLMDLLFETTMVHVKGIEGKGIDDEGASGPPLPTVDAKKYPPRIDNPDDLPTWVTKGIKGKFDGLDLDKAKINVTDERTDKSEAEPEPKEPEEPKKEKPEPITPPVPVPKPTDNKSFAVAVFTGPKGVQVYRVLKKNTLSRYRSGAKSAGDTKGADLFKGMVDKYDNSINALRAAGLIVNDKKLQTALGNISTGKDGDKISFEFKRGDKNIKSKTGGFTQMKSAKTVDDIRNNILGADGKKVKDAGKLVIVYLVGSNVVKSMAQSTKMSTDKVKTVITKVIKMWNKYKKSPKSDKLPFDADDKVKDALKKNGLVESLEREQVVYENFDMKTLTQAIKEIKEHKEMERWAQLAGI